MTAPSERHARNQYIDGWCWTWNMLRRCCVRPRIFYPAHRNPLAVNTFTDRQRSSEAQDHFAEDLQQKFGAPSTPVPPSVKLTKSGRVWWVLYLFQVCARFASSAFRVLNSVFTKAFSCVSKTKTGSFRWSKSEPSLSWVFDILLTIRVSFPFLP